MSESLGINLIVYTEKSQVGKFFWIFWTQAIITFFNIKMVDFEFFWPSKDLCRNCNQTWRFEYLKNDEYRNK